MDWPEFERFCQIKGLRPVRKVDDPEAIIGIAETDWENDRPGEYPLGYYQTAYAVGGRNSKGKVDFAVWIEFDALHDKDEGWTQEAKRQARINKTLKEARTLIEKCEYGKTHN